MRQREYVHMYACTHSLAVTGSDCSVVPQKQIFLFIAMCMNFAFPFILELYLLSKFLLWITITVTVRQYACIFLDHVQ